MNYELWMMNDEWWTMNDERWTGVNSRVLEVVGPVMLKYFSNGSFVSFGWFLEDFEGLFGIFRFFFPVYRVLFGIFDGECRIVRGKFRAFHCFWFFFGRDRRFFRGFWEVFDGKIYFFLFQKNFSHFFFGGRGTSHFGKQLMVNGLCRIRGIRPVFLLQLEITGSLSRKGGVKGFWGCAGNGAMLVMRRPCYGGKLGFVPGFGCHKTRDFRMVRMGVVGIILVQNWLASASKILAGSINGPAVGKWPTIKILLSKQGCFL